MKKRPARRPRDRAPEGRDRRSYYVTFFCWYRSNSGNAGRAIQMTRMNPSRKWRVYRSRRRMFDCGRRNQQTQLPTPRAVALRALDMHQTPGPLIWINSDWLSPALSDPPNLVTGGINGSHQYVSYCTWGRNFQQ